MKKFFTKRLKKQISQYRRNNKKAIQNSDAKIEESKQKIPNQEPNAPIQEEPSYGKGYILRANVYAEIYFLQNNGDATFADFGKTIKMNQKFGGGYAGIAKIYAKRADKEKAVENYNFAKKYDMKYSKTADAEIKALSTSSS